MQGGRTFKLWGQTDCFQILQILPFLSDYRESQTSSEYNPVPLQRLYNRGDDRGGNCLCEDIRDPVISKTRVRSRDTVVDGAPQLC